MDLKPFTIIIGPKKRIITEKETPIHILTLPLTRIPTCSGMGTLTITGMSHRTLIRMAGIMPKL